MKKFYKIAMGPLLLFLAASFAFAQTSISGKVTDAATGEPLAGVNIVVKGRVVGTISTVSGEFNLKVNDSPPLTLQLSFVGYASQEVTIKTRIPPASKCNYRNQPIL
ncbi:MAG: TonB-dependent receptor, partial [Bacteroidia bacterium]|nr:TonB-dependent receptor [Bacteroidia bacterium]